MPNTSKHRHLLKNHCQNLSLMQNITIGPVNAHMILGPIRLQRRCFDLMSVFLCKKCGCRGKIYMTFGHFHREIFFESCEIFMLY